MMKLRFLRLLTTLAVLLLPGIAMADSNRPARMIPVAMAQKLTMPAAKKLVVPVAQHMRVDEGVFELEVGKSIDLTDRKILLALRQYNRDCCVVVLNGDSSTARRVGERFNLKKERYTSSFVTDKEVCVLDIVDIALPKGAPGIYTFRLNCP